MIVTPVSDITVWGIFHEVVGIPYKVSKDPWHEAVIALNHRISYSPYMTAMIAKNPDAVYAALGGSALVPFVKQAKIFGLFDKVPVFIYALTDSVFPRALKDDMPVGAYGGNNYLWYYPDTAANKACVAKWLEYTTKAGKPDPYPSGPAVFGPYCSATFMVHLGLSNAATIRAGNALGRKDRAHLEKGAITVTGMSLAVSVLTITLFLTY